MTGRRYFHENKCIMIIMSTTVLRPVIRDETCEFFGRSIKRFLNVLWKTVTEELSHVIMVL